ncbi:MAG: HpcH/HpaI aldolase family protein [Alphaproteobacteria bacterium]
MPAPKNVFKEALRSGEPQLGTWLGFADAYVAEAAATADFDWFLIDGEHAPNDIPSILPQISAVQGAGRNAVVRLPIGEGWMIKQALDLGVQTLLMPMVDSAELAKELVRGCLYPPHGNRGVGSALARASGFSQIKDYLPTANEEICLLVQVESRAGLEALDDILKVVGIDGVFIGPADLAADMGYLGQTDAPEVIAAIEDALTRIRNAGKAAGIMATDEASAKKWADQGANFIAVAIDVLVYAQNMRALAKARKALIKGPSTADTTPEPEDDNEAQ